MIKIFTLSYSKLFTHVRTLEMVLVLNLIKVVGFYKGKR